MKLTFDVLPLRDTEEPEDNRMLLRRAFPEDCRLSIPSVAWLGRWTDGNMETQIAESVRMPFPDVLSSLTTHLSCGNQIAKNHSIAAGVPANGWSDTKPLLTCASLAKSDQLKGYE